jgi:phytanoyl-CoA hydroxylase
MLSIDQIAAYHRDGFLAVADFVTPEACRLLRERANEIVASFEPTAQRTVFTTDEQERTSNREFLDSGAGIWCFFEPDALGQNGELTRDKALSINKIGHAMHDLVPEFHAFCRLPLFGELLRDLGYRAPVLWQSMYILKPPRIGGEVRWHQDATYLATDPPCVTGVWVALEDAHRGNGCLWAQPGGHRGPLRERWEIDWSTRRGTLQRLDDTPWPSNDEAVALEVPAGSVVLFHDHLPHWSGHNHSDVSRHAFTMHVAERGAAWRASNWLQRPRLGYFEL